jgi:hypothetical protein
MVMQRSGPQGKPGEKWLRDLTPDNATAPAPDPTSDYCLARLRWRLVAAPLPNSQCLTHGQPPAPPGWCPTRAGNDQYFPAAPRG